jgi:hypothetical protein
MEMTPLNIFQRVMRVWEEAHPYNAAQIMELAGTADVGRLTDAWNEVLAASGLGHARVAGRWFCYEPAPRQEVTVVDPVVGLDGYITRELNRPFCDPPPRRSAPCTTMPFRPFVLQGKGSYHLGVIYQHWVADSVSVRMLLREWFCHIHDPAQVRRQRLEMPEGGFWRYFGPRRGGWKLVPGVLATVRSTAEFARARKIDRESGPQEVACSVHRLPDGTVDELVAGARRRKVTLNDMIVAALARACDEHGANPRRAEKDMALGTIVDLRATSMENMENTFGMFLGFMGVVVPAGHLRDREELLNYVAAHSARQKERKAAQASMVRMAIGYAQGRMLSARQLASFYRNYMPFSGGVSNVNMNRSWPAAYHPSPLVDYVRVAPTGPMVPLVVAVTTLGKRFSFVLTRRASLVDEGRGAQLAQAFIDELTARAGAG